MEKPIVTIEVSGGCVEVTGATGPVRVITREWDNINAEEDPTDYGDIIDDFDDSRPHNLCPYCGWPVWGHTKGAVCELCERPAWIEARAKADDHFHRLDVHLLTPAQLEKLGDMVRGELNRREV